ncbi:molybdopterin-synthase adenylyltransferase MoeB [Cesiribacter sp. SM1]|uniref:molybdopterin-synthase adenylyltransferase MoeB n=1 Tax=Cesiribacter sp. SM1 TaxID=2861196 RepID=UPI001CD5B89C|nr:molybdopterin-synthase adenylyltransferase MoeB [Cesiribacter sp. SM1]
MSNSPFTPEELQRYNRHLILPQFGHEGQRKLKEAKVLVVGTGGLGCPLLLYLAAAGVGTIGLLDFDVVDRSNLQRQVLYTVEDVGTPKVEAAKKRLQGLNPNVTFITHNTRITSENALQIIKAYDVVADGTDNFPTRYLVNDACVLLDKPLVYASIFQFDGQASVFNYHYPDGSRGPNYRDLFPHPPLPHMVPSCAEGGVLGVLPGLLGTIQANEVIKVITGIGETLSGRLFLYDALSFSTRTLKVAKDPQNPLTGENPTIHSLIDYEAFCGVGRQEQPLQEISATDLKAMLDAGEDFQLIDVREPHEWEDANIGGELIPLKSLEKQLDKVARCKKVVLHCRGGQRSAQAIKLLQEQGYQNLYNLKGGILAWAQEVDEDMIVG